MIIRQDYYFGLNSISPNNSTQYYWGTFLNQMFVNSDQGVAESLPLDVSLEKVVIRAHVLGTKSSLEDLEVYIEIDGGVQQHLMTAFTLDQNTNYGSADTLGISISAGEPFSFFLNTPAWVTKPTFVNGITITCYFDTGTERKLSLQKYHGMLTSGGGWNPNIRTIYNYSLGGQLIGEFVTSPFPQYMPFDGTVIGSVQKCLVQGVAGVGDPSITSVEVDDVLSLTGGPGFDANSGLNEELIAIDTMDVQFSQGSYISAAFETPNWSVSATDTIQSCTLLIEEL